MNPFQIFTHPMFGEVRAAILNNQPFFVGKDVAKALGYDRADMAIKRHVAQEDKTTMLVATFQCMKRNEEVKKNPSYAHTVTPVTVEGAKRRMTVINESGLYSLVLSSHAPLAQEFKHWVTSEVLPAIRKDGFYSLLEQIPAPEMPAPPALATTEINEELIRLQNQIAKPCANLAVVYVLLMGNGTIKIGMTKDLTDRIQQIQAESGIRVLDFRSTRFMPREEAAALEMKLKEKYAASCLGGEFFDVRFLDVAAQL